MVRIICIALCAVGIGVFAVGCGSDSKSDSTATSAAPASTSSGSGGATSGGSSATDPAVKAAVDSCKSSIDQNPAVKADIKPDLEKICEKAANGDIKSAQEATKQVCLKIVESSVPSGAAQDQAKQACNQTTGG